MKTIIALLLLIVSVGGIYALSPSGTEYDFDADCVDPDTCYELSAEEEQELGAWAEEFDSGTRAFTEAPSLDEEQLIATYAVASGESIALSEGDDVDEYRQIWKEIAALSPDEISAAYIEQFGVYADESGDTLAYVDDADGNGKWRVVVNIAQHKATSIREQKSTLIHELAHIISLNRSWTVTSESCTTLELEEGCFSENAPIYAFWKSFWKGGAQQYSQSDFVTEYAATDVTEDWAESFTFFVLQGTQTLESGKLKDEKVRSMYATPSFVSYRNAMRKVLGTEVLRAKRGG